MKTGDRVCWVETYVKYVVRVHKNEIYTIKAEWACQCGIKRFDVGIKVPYYCYGSICCSCSSKSDDGIAWPESKYFAPIEYNSATEELANKEIVKETLDIPIKEPVL